MVQVPLPQPRLYSYPLFGGAYDGAMFVCGPGRPHDPPLSIELTERRDGGISGNEVEVTHRYIWNRREERYQAT